jgi:hypothetical protein
MLALSSECDWGVCGARVVYSFSSLPPPVPVYICHVELWMLALCATYGEREAPSGADSKEMIVRVEERQLGGQALKEPY